jgi:NAD(P)-dependent dehydrogenase (short-subunit alcohol dehydrogenase family)
MRVIVTGGGSGIGKASSLRINKDTLARTGHGARFVLADLLEDRVTAVAASLRAEGAEVVEFVGDAADPDVPARLAAAAEQAFGGLDGVLNNAGRAWRAPLIDLTLEEWERGFALNVRAAFLVSRAAYPMLLASKGAIVNIGSVSGIHPQPFLGSYSPAKAAVIMLTAQMAMEWGPDGIRANCVSPGITHTANVDWILRDPVKRGQREGITPSRRIGTPDEIAAAVAFLIGPDSSFVNGENLVADGGLSRTAMAQLR